MHPSLEELLDLRDGEGTPEAADHVRECDRCRREMERLSGISRELKMLEDSSPPRDLWPDVRESLQRSRGGLLWKRLGWGAAAVLTLAAGICAAVFFSDSDGPGVPQHTGRAELAELPHLIRESQRLEHLVGLYEEQAPFLTGREAGVILAVEDRIAVLDAAIAREQGTGSSRRELSRLWGERVRLLDTLLAVHERRSGNDGNRRFI